ncbi:NirD/YgiW/YdeI family stress tolerance protein [Actinobacillus equuli subsp. haemolyticus]|uniref:YgiW/YdeI family stress tolerance OB fold protein n=1 Tax=Actinobacillus equuli TaxID=718 RepID=UPI0024417127|nr:NirD/YgiW/YdeI family stress tolerance protein [Actinobacillus equuli]WGE66567.1 NirD/YgiW/YdeI family stress tolerance protein [Actinobacillus equuli subsp. haemolyticus]WGE81698.1 NirD/YgiW/YdeI family stress tolerance protein [Actinobacillus equuli subsp. haemolyticus]
MKKLLALTAILAISSPAMAGFESTTSANNGGFKSNHTNVQAAAIKNVAQAKKARDNAHFALTGNIINCYDNDDCTFKDSTGSVHIDIEDGAWQGKTVNANNRVRISGKVDHDDGRVTLDVNNITVLK